MDATVRLDGKKEIARVLRKENQGGTQGGGTLKDPGDNGELG